MDKEEFGFVPTVCWLGQGIRGFHLCIAGQGDGCKLHPQPADPPSAWDIWRWVQETPGACRVGMEWLPTDLSVFCWLFPAGFVFALSALFFGPLRGPWLMWHFPPRHAGLRPTRRGVDSSQGRWPCRGLRPQSAPTFYRVSRFLEADVSFLK